METAFEQKQPESVAKHLAMLLRIGKCQVDISWFDLISGKLAQRT